MADQRPPTPDHTDAMATATMAVLSAAPAAALIATALAQLDEGVVVADASGRITFVNDAAARLHGVARLDVPVEAYAETYHLLTETGEPYPSDELPLARAVLHGETVRDAHWRIRRPDGSEIAAVGTAQPVLGPAGERVGAVLTLRDETQRVEAERRAAQILAQVADAHASLDADFRIVSFNRVAAESLGKSADDVIGLTHWEVFPASVGTEIERRYRRVAAQGVEEHFTHHYVGEGYDIHVEIDAYPMPAGGIAMFWRDVTARVVAERDLQTRNAELAEQTLALEQANLQLSVSEQSLRTLADAIPTLAWTARADGYIDWYNARWYAYTGTTAAAMEGWGWQSVHDPVQLPEIMARWQESVTSGVPFEMTFPLRGANGRFRRFLTRVVPTRDADGRVARWFGTNTDVEEERAARESAEAAATRTRQLQQLTESLGAATTIDDVASVVITQAGVEMGTRTATLFLRDPASEAAMIVRHAGVDQHTIDQFNRTPIDWPGPGARCLRTGEPVFVESADGPDGLYQRYPEIRDVFERHGIASVATVPLSVAGVVIGSLSFSFATARVFTPDARDFFLAVGRQAAQALDRARLLESERRATSRAERLQTLIGRLNAAQSADDVADAVFEGGMAAVGADAGSMAIVHLDRDGEPGSFEMIRAAGVGASVVERYRRFPFAAGRPISEAVRTRRLTLVTSASEWSVRFPDATESLQALGFEAFAAVPVVSAGRVLAALSFSFRESRRFDDATRTFLVTIGEQCALALQRQYAHDAQLRHADEHAALLETIDDPFLAIDARGRFTYVNAQAEALLGQPADALLGRSVVDVFPTLVGSAFDTGVRRVLQTGETLQVEAVEPMRQRWIDARMYPAPHGVSIVFQDVTERRRAQDAATFMASASGLLSASLEYESTLQALAHAVVPVLGDWCAVDMLVDPDAGAWPPEVKRIAVMHQDPAKVARAHELAETMPQDWAADTGLAAALRRGATEYIPVITDDMLVAAAKTAEDLAILRELDFHSYLCVPLRARGRTLGALTLCMTESKRHYDDADRRLVEDLAQRAATAVDNARLYRDAERARQAAEAANYAKSEFLSTMSHELRTPLNAIGGYAELLRLGIRGPVTEAQQQDLERLTRANQHLLALISDVLTFARVERGQVEMHLAPFETAPLIADLEALMGPQVAAKGIRFTHDECTDGVRGAAPVARADVEKVRQILLNVLTNAIKFTPAGGRVSLECDGDTAAGVVRFSVIDTGRGIPSDQLERIFEPFVQVDRHLTQESQQGIGLGLAISRDLARAMRGDLVARSERGAGSTFVLTLPMA